MTEEIIDHAFGAYEDERDGVILGESKNISSSQRKAWAKKGLALPDGSYPIPNRDYLKRAIQAFGRAGNKARVKKWIIRRARALGATSLLPDDWKVSAEAEADDFSKEIVLPLQLGTEGVPALELIAEGEGGNAPWRERGAERYRVPLYVANSFADIPGFSKRFYFDKGPVMSEMVAEINRHVKTNPQPLNVYTRHNVAHASYDLPVGGIVGAEDKGSVAYGILEIEPTADGKDVMVLAAGKKLNAISLRSGPGDFVAEVRTVEGEDVYYPTKLRVTGADFAPDSPAMPTYGLQRLTAEARVEPYEIETQEEEIVPELSLETVKKEHPSIVTEIEAPYRKQVAELTTSLEAEQGKVKSLENKVKEQKDEIKKLEAETAKADLTTYAHELAQKFPEAARKDAQDLFLETIKEKELTAREDLDKIVMPIVLEAFATGKLNMETPKPSVEDRLRGLIVKPNGSAKTEDDEKKRLEAEKEHPGGEVRIGDAVLALPLN